MINKPQIMNSFSFKALVCSFTIYMLLSSELISQSCNNLKAENIETSFDWGASFNVNVSVERHRFSVFRPNKTEIRYRKDGTSTWTNRSAAGRLTSYWPSIEYSYDCLIQFLLPADGSLYEMQARLDCDTEGTGNWVNKNFRMPCSADRTDDLEFVEGNVITIEDDYADEGWLSDDEGRTFFRKVNFQNGKVVFSDLAENYPYQYKQRIRCDNQSWSNFSNTAETISECNKPRNNEISFNLKQMDSRLEVTCAKPATLFEFKYKRKGNSLWYSSNEISRSNFTIPDVLSPGDTYEVQCKVACGQWNTWTEYSNVIEYTVPVDCLKPVSDFGSKDITNHEATLYCRGDHQGGVVEGHLFRYRKTSNPNWIERESVSNSFTLSNLDPNSEYEFEVQHQCVANFNSRWSDTKMFTTDRNCEPTSGAISIINVSYTSALLRCSQTEREGYIWEVKRVVDGRKILTTSLQTDNEYLLETLEQGEEYEVRLKLYCNPDYSNYTEPVSFTTLTCNVPEMNDVSVDNITNTSAYFNFAGNILEGIEWQYRKSGNANWKKYNSRVNLTLIDSLVANTDYEYRCRSKCEDNPASYSDWTEIQNFKTNCDAFIENFSGVGINQITVHANNAHADEYSFRYRMSGSGLWTQSQSQPQRQFTAINLMPDTEYEFQVQSICNNLFSSWSESAFMSTDELMVQPCAKPNRLNVAATNITSSSARLNNFRNDVDAYYFRYFDGANWITSSELNVGYYDINSLQENTRYYYQARVKCGNTLSEWSDTLRFRTLEAVVSLASGCFEPYTSQLVPLLITTNSALLLCDEDDSELFQFRYKDSSSTVWIETISDVSNRNQISGLSPNTVYEFQCKLYCNGKFGQYSGSRYFKTQSIAPCVEPSTDNFIILRAGPDYAQTYSLNLSKRYQYRYRPIEDSIWTYTDTSFRALKIIPELKYATSYAIQFRHECNANQMTDFSNVKLFSTLPFCPSLSQSSILIKNIEKNAAVLQLISTATAHLIRIRKIGDSIWTRRLLYLETELNLKPLDPNSEYELQILTICDDDNLGKWSPVVKFTTLGATSAKNLEQTHFKIVPTLVDREVQVLSNKNFTTSDFIIYNLNGDKIMSGNLNANGQIQLEHLTAGFYTIQFILKGMKYQCKFIKL